MAMGATQDLELAKETLEFIDKKAKDQDVMYFFNALGSSNFKTRRLLTQYFQENYDAVCFLSLHTCALFTNWGQIYKRFEGNFSLNYLVTVSGYDR
jgi:aminopeptidase 2